MSELLPAPNIQLKKAHHSPAYGPADLPHLLAFVNNPLVQNTLISDHIVPRNHRFATKIEEIANEALLYVIIEAIDKPTGPRVIGAASITVANVKNRDVNFGIGLVPDVWGQGYVSEVTEFLVDYAFKNLAIHRISLGVLDSNLGAIKLYKRIGCVEEGRKRQSNFFDGKWQDSIHMGILESEWFAKKREQSTRAVQA
ncbi:Spermidine N(1)-acetyltransferase [Psilocybe cubensis]|uniref:Spermidine N(1)-acetyltransferase n=2 Tax=Psilocybe cubensis TaxID=181762 RepID=A0ACB8GYC6_PSICU|nr:Spermidine N(1)-acetyltransferase [Psilocybe cubensis]KAH9480464.1 Spermidine N(1)-acetyltransferase [Psilocybe cubensis]